MYAKHWSFTYHNVEENNNHEFLVDNAKLNKVVVYLVYQLERAPTTNALHYQGYISFSKSIQMPRVKKILLSDKVHLEISKGTPEQNKVYCTKDDTRFKGPWEYGKLPERNQGHRSDLDQFKDGIQIGLTDKDLADINFESWCRYNKSFDRYRLAITSKRDWVMRVYWIYGPAGKGKSKMAYEMAGQDSYWKDNSNKWFDGYKFEECVVIDDYRNNGKIEFNFLLRLLDRYPMTVETKGSSLPFLSKKIIITSPHDPTFTAGEDSAQLLRRITEVINIEKTADITY